MTHTPKNTAHVEAVEAQDVRLSQADTHLHTNYSDGKGTVEEVLHVVECRTDLDVIAVTDHDTIEGALRARDLAARRNYRFEVIIGEEISTREGHVLALFLERPIPPNLSIERSIELVHDQGGLAIVAHPFNRAFRFSVQREVMNRLLRQPELHPDGVETINGSFAGIGVNAHAHVLTRDLYHWAETGGSDAHTVNALGCARTIYPGVGAEGLRQALLRRETVAEGSFWHPREYFVFVPHMLAYKRGLVRPAVPALEHAGAHEPHHDATQPAASHSAHHATRRGRIGRATRVALSRGAGSERWTRRRPVPVER